MQELLTIRPWEKKDVTDIINYWENSTPEDFERMGVIELSKFPPIPERRRALEEALLQTEKSCTLFYLIWEVNGRSIGFNSLKNIVQGEQGEMHLHMWDKEGRGKGRGGILFCLAALEFFKRFQLKTMSCEPKSTNPLPNRMLQKIGFPLTRSYVGASSELSQVTELNSYDITQAIAVQYLRAQGIRI